MIKDTWTRVLAKNALKEKPGAIVVESNHALLMRKDLKIPKNKFFLMTPLEKRDLQQLRGIRRFQIARRKARKQRMREIGKKRNEKNQRYYGKK